MMHAQLVMTTRGALNGPVVFRRFAHVPLNLGLVSRCVAMQGTLTGSIATHPHSEARASPAEAIQPHRATDAKYIPRWLSQAQQAIIASDEFRLLCHEILRHVEQRRLTDTFTESTHAEQCNLLDDIYAQILTDGGSTNQYELLVRTNMDVALCNAVLIARNQPTEQNLLETIERITATGILSLLSSLPRESYRGAIQSLLGRALPSQLRAPLWNRRLEHSAAEEEFHRQQSASRLGMISNDDLLIASMCQSTLGTSIDGIDPLSLEAMKVALSFDAGADVLACYLTSTVSLRFLAGIATFDCTVTDGNSRFLVSSCGSRCPL